MNDEANGFHHDGGGGDESEEIHSKTYFSSSPPTKYLQEPSSHLKCPVCENVYKDPVINVKCGHTFCQDCASSVKNCPLDDSPCESDQLVLNRSVLNSFFVLNVGGFPN